MGKCDSRGGSRLASLKTMRWMRTGTWKVEVASGCQRRMRTSGASCDPSVLRSRWDVGPESGRAIRAGADGFVKTRHANDVHDGWEAIFRPATGCGAPKVNTDSTRKRMDKTCSEMLLNINSMLHGIRLRKRKFLVLRMRILSADSRSRKVKQDSA